MPYEWNWSQDVEKCTLDLVLSSSTRANTIQTTVLASKECPKFLQDLLVVLVVTGIPNRPGVGVRLERQTTGAAVAGRVAPIETT